MYFNKKKSNMNVEFYEFTNKTQKIGEKIDNSVKCQVANFSMVPIAILLLKLPVSNLEVLETCIKALRSEFASIMEVVYRCFVFLSLQPAREEVAGALPPPLAGGSGRDLWDGLARCALKRRSWKRRNTNSCNSR